jgi:hypothetical protein
MTASREPGPPLRRRPEASDNPRSRGLFGRLGRRRARRREAARAKREAARRERAAIEREKAAARRERVASAAPKPARAPRPKRARPRARPTARGAANRIAAFGERSSALLRAAAAPVVDRLVTIGLLARGGLARVAVAVSPLRAVIAVTAIAAVVLGVSQFVDYRGVAVGVDDYSAYSDVEAVAPPPQVDRKTAGSAHAYLLVPVALAALALLVACARGRWQLGRMISLLGLVALAVSIAVDVPAGLDEGEQAIAYAGVEAKLLEGFYVQVFSAAVLVVAGLLVSRYARPARRRSPAQPRGAPVRPLGARPA